MARAGSGRQSAPPKRRGGGLVGALFSLALIGAALAFAAGLLFLAETNRPGPAEADGTVLVERGATAASIGQTLQQEGKIRSALLFRAALRVYANGKTLQAGEYEIPAHANLVDIVDRMTNGEAVQHAITFPEGITIATAMRIIAENDYLTGDLPEAPPEGSILPETYHVQRGMTRAALLQQMRDARDQAVAEIWAGRAPNLPVATPEEMVTLASIVEKETGIASERPMVASAFTNRLRRPMRLESDPTIIYGVCLRHPERCRDGRLVDAAGNPRGIRQSEIELNTGYNTYRIDRLPPTPISNPGRLSLEAVAHPAESDAIFFVADGTGGHVFAATVAQHNANVARWRQIERGEIPRPAPAAPAPR